MLLRDFTQASRRSLDNFPRTNEISTFNSVAERQTPSLVRRPTSWLAPSVKREKNRHREIPLAGTLEFPDDEVKLGCISLLHEMIDRCLL